MENTINVPQLDTISNAVKAEVVLCRKIERAINGQPIDVVMNALGRSLHAVQSYARKMTTPQPNGGPAGIVSGDIAEG